MGRDLIVAISIILLVASLGSAMFYAFEPEPCESYACFRDHLARCQSAIYVHEESEASWRYNVLYERQGSCEIEVTLLQSKEGDLKLREFEGHKMTCVYPVGAIVYPEKDLSRCNGTLKEDLQSIIIEKLHTYILNNLDEVRTGLADLGP